MNRVIFFPGESPEYISAHDARYTHIVEVLRVRKGDTIRVGRLNGEAGTAEILSVSEKGIQMAPSWIEDRCGRLYPVHMLIGHPRPSVLHRIVKDLCTVGVSSIFVALSDLGETSYARSHFWTKKKYLQALAEGASQAGVTCVPECRFFSRFDVMLQITEPQGPGICLDEDASGLLALDAQMSSCRLAVGSERGWSERERNILRDAGFSFCSLGPRVMRTETACLAAASYVVRELHRKV